MFNNFFDLKR